MMDLATPTSEALQVLQSAFGARVKFDVPLAKYTSSRVGGLAKAIAFVESVSELAEVVILLWGLPLPFAILGGGSNVLVSDDGYPGVIVLNHARQVRFNIRREPPNVWAASGANLGLVARYAAARGLSGLEWAAGIPGTIGGAVVGNAGAHGGDMAGNLFMAEILHRKDSVADSQNGNQNIPNVIQEQWPVERLKYDYRMSSIKYQQRLKMAPNVEEFSATDYQPHVVVQAASLRLSRSLIETIQEIMEANVAFRRRTQPPGASMGSMFKNPPNDYAGRLIESAGLKGARRGDAEISQLHANFFINHGRATATQIFDLIQFARQTVEQKFGVTLELEIELVGIWDLGPNS